MVKSTPNLARRRPGSKKASIEDTFAADAMDKRTQLSLVITPELRRRIALAAELNEVSQREYVIHALEEALVKDRSAIDAMQKIRDQHKKKDSQ